MTREPKTEERKFELLISFWGRMVLRAGAIVLLAVAAYWTTYLVKITIGIFQ